MLPSLRSALLLCAAVGLTIVAPAQADPSDAPLTPATVASYPKVPVANLLDPEGEPEIAGAQEQNAIAPDSDEDGSVASHRGADLATLVADLRDADAGSHEVECLAVGVYFEAKSEPLAGQLAVGQVIANRANSGGRFPPSYCGVLFQRGQFSFVHGRSLPAVPRSSRQWQTAVAIAKIVDQDLKDSEVGNALFFHARYVSPGWRLKRVAAIGNHIFYR
jgi:spore germination cell wall hydrolase CwlJ-like protein